MLRIFVSKNSITPNDIISVKKNDDNVFYDFINKYIELLKKVEPEFYEYIMKIEPRFPIIPYTKKSLFCIFNKNEYISPRNNNSTHYLINLNLFIYKTKKQYTIEIKPRFINFIPTPTPEKNEFDDIHSIHLNVYEQPKPLHNFKPLIHNKQTINPTLEEPIYSEERQIERIKQIYGSKRIFNL
jgi:hypothetical protein